MICMNVLYQPAVNHIISREAWITILVIKSGPWAGSGPSRLCVMLLRFVLKKSINATHVTKIDKLV